jgi:aldehyde:ferredoxin oxidoreductase
VNDIRTAAIGPAGEKLVGVACVETDDGRTAGRTGLGAVMGSKNLKAIATKGTGKVGIANPARFEELSKEATKRILEKKPLPFGTSGSVVAFEEMGNLPIKNWSAGRFPGAAKISGQTMAETLLEGKKTCFACPVACGRYVEIKEGPYSPLEGFGPEYEAIGTLGSLCMNDNLESIVKATDTCNRLGIDVISTGAIIAFAMECYSKGLITRKETGGIDLSWGNHQAVVQMCELIGRREGFGIIMGDGVKAAAEKLDKGSESFALHVKGLELPAHSPYRFKENGLAYAVSNRGACHNRGSPAYISRGLVSPEIGLGTKTDGFTIEGKGRMTKLHQDVCAATDALGLCKFPVFFGGIGLELIAGLYSAATGWETSVDDMMTMGERIWTLQRIFNTRMGVTRKDDTLPDRFLKEPLPDGAAKGQVVELEPMLKEYYEQRGLNEDGKPKREKLKELGLDYAIQYT